MRTRGPILIVSSVALAAALCVVLLTVADTGGDAQLQAGRPHGGAVLRDSTTVHNTGGSTRADGNDGSAKHRTRAAAGAHSIALSVFAGGGASAVVHAANTTLAGAVSGAFDYVPDNSWETIGHPQWMVDAWAGQGLKLTLAVPMLTNSGTNLTTCATGAYDQYFSDFAQTFISSGFGDATLAIGWDPETGPYPWHVHNAWQAYAYVRCWRQIHNAIASTPGAHFTYLWEAGDPPPMGNVPLARLYPGNGYVDIITTSAMDTPTAHTPPARQWPEQARWSYGADWAARFASSHHKRIALFMLDLSTGDNGTYVTQVMHWAARHHAVSITIWDYGTGALLTGHFPAVTKALQAAQAAGYFRAGSGGREGE